MTTGEKIYEYRRKAGMTQEALAERLGVSRQAVSKWEADLSFPETENILALCKLFSCSADELLLGAEQPQIKERARGERFHYEYCSKTRVFGLPLVHVNLGVGVYCAKGVFAVGNAAAGIFALGAVSAGVVSLGALSLGILALGAITLGLLSLGSIAFGVMVFGGIAVGVYTFGGIAVGYIAVGGLSAGRFAVGDWAFGYLAAGRSRVSGSYAFRMPDELDSLSQWLSANVSPALKSLIEFFAKILD